jgi:hypothetical protein
MLCYASLSRSWMNDPYSWPHGREELRGGEGKDRRWEKRGEHVVLAGRATVNGWKKGKGTGGGEKVNAKWWGLALARAGNWARAQRPRRSEGRAGRSRGPHRRRHSTLPWRQPARPLPAVTTTAASQCNSSSSACSSTRRPGPTRRR